MADPKILYAVTAVVFAGLAVWLAFVFRTAKEPWAVTAAAKKAPAPAAAATDDDDDDDDDDDESVAATDDKEEKAG